MQMKNFHQCAHLAFIKSFSGIWAGLIGPAPKTFGGKKHAKKRRKKGNAASRSHFLNMAAATWPDISFEKKGNPVLMDLTKTHQTGAMPGKFPMSSFNRNAFKRKTALLNLANVSKARKLVGFSRAAFHRRQKAVLRSDAKSKARRPQTKGICECFHKTLLEEFCQPAFSRKLYSISEESHRDFADWLAYYNNKRTHQGKMRCGWS